MTDVLNVFLAVLTFVLSVISIGLGAALADWGTRLWSALTGYALIALGVAGLTSVIYAAVTNATVF